MNVCFWEILTAKLDNPYRGSTVFALRKETTNTLSAYLKPDNGCVSIYKGGIGLLREIVS